LSGDRVRALAALRDFVLGPCQPYLAAVAEHADCMHRLSASGVQRQGALDARAKLAGPAGKEDEERDEKRLSKADRTARPTSSATFSTLSTRSGPCVDDD